MKIRNKDDGHLSSAMCQSSIDDAMEIMSAISGIEDCCLPTWWISKLAVASAYLNSLRDYVTYNMDDILEESGMEEGETAEEEAAESPEEQASEMAAGIEQPIESDDMMDIADEMLPPSARMMKNAAKAR
jgi:hypothetical protein